VDLAAGIVDLKALDVIPRASTFACKSAGERYWSSEAGVQAPPWLSALAPVAPRAMTATAAVAAMVKVRRIMISPVAPAASLAAR
jgi:hypothetical protein